MKRVLALSFVLAALPALADPATAQANPGTRHNASEPIHVASDSFVAERVPMKSGPGIINGTYIGNVIITQGDVKMRADSVRIVLVGGHADRALANGHIVITSANSGTMTGDSGVYEIGPRVATVTGHVVLTKEKNVMRGAQLTVNMITGIAKLGGGVTGSRGGRVEGIFTPPPQTDGK